MKSQVFFLEGFSQYGIVNDSHGIYNVHNITSYLQRVLHFDELSSQIAGGTGSSRRRRRLAPAAPGRGGGERGGGEHVDLAPQELQLLFLLLYHLLQLRRFLQEKEL